MNIVIVGGSFAGIHAAIYLRPTLSTTLPVSPTPFRLSRLRFSARLAYAAPHRSAAGYMKMEAFHRPFALFETSSTVQLRFRYETFYFVQFHCIARLVESLYRIISKVLASRLKRVMGKLISQYQATFMFQRQKLVF